jgi:CDP-glycerol glycerophosphotransferase (TagB/SpsB family)
MKKLNITFCSFPDYSSNAKPLYEYMCKTYKDKMNFNWAVSSDEMKEKLNSMGIAAYKIGTEEYFNEMKNTDVFFSTHCNILGEKNPNSLYIDLWHGISPKHIGYMSDNMTEDDKNWYFTIKEKVDYFIVPSEFWRVIFATRFNMDYSRILSLGYPKLDYMINKDAKKNLAKVIDRDISSYDKVIYYMPTFRCGCNRKQESQINTDNLINIQNYDEEKLLNYLKEKNYLLCIKKHPSEEIELKSIDSYNVKVIEESSLAKNGYTVNDILNAADLMITDYSSLGIEFVFLDKPVVYLTNDIEEYRKNRGFTFDNISFWMASYQVKKIDELIDAIDGSFSDNFKYKEELKNRKQLWFSDLKNGGCDRICNYLFDEDKINSNICKREYTILDELENKLKETERLVDEKNKVIAQREERIKELDEFIQKIINSKGWQFLEKVRKIKGVRKNKK